MTCGEWALSLCREVGLVDKRLQYWTLTQETQVCVLGLKGNSGIFKPRPYFWHEIRSSTHREQFGESRRPSEDI